MIDVVDAAPPFDLFGAFVAFMLDLRHLETAFDDFNDLLLFDFVDDLLG